MLLKRAHSNERRGKGAGGGGQSFLWYSLLTVILSAGGKSVSVTPFKWNPSNSKWRYLFIYLILKWNLELFKFSLWNVGIEGVAREFHLVVLNYVIMTLMKYVNSDHPFYKP